LKRTRCAVRCERNRVAGFEVLKLIPFKMIVFASRRCAIGFFLRAREKGGGGGGGGWADEKKLRIFSVCRQRRARFRSSIPVRFQFSQVSPRLRSTLLIKLPTAPNCSGLHPAPISGGKGAAMRGADSPSIRYIEQKMKDSSRPCPW